MKKQIAVPIVHIRKDLSDTYDDTGTYDLERLYPILKEHFSEPEILWLYTPDDDYVPQVLTLETLQKYFPPEIYADKAKRIIAGDSYFFDLNLKRPRGRFEITFADKLLQLLLEKKTTKTSTAIPDIKPISITVGSGTYQIRLMTDTEYQEGLILFIGEFFDLCQSIGKFGGNVSLFDLLSDKTRTFLITRKIEIDEVPHEVIVGQNLIWLDDTKKGYCFDSLELAKKKPHHCPSKAARILTQKLAIEILTKDDTAQEINIGIGGRTLVNLGFTGFTPYHQNYKDLGVIRNKRPTYEHYDDAKTRLEAHIGMPINAYFYLTRVHGLQDTGFKDQDRKDSLVSARFLDRKDLDAFKTKTERTYQRLATYSDYLQLKNQFVHKTLSQLTRLITRFFNTSDITVSIEKARVYIALPKDPALRSQLIATAKRFPKTNLLRINPLKDKISLKLSSGSLRKHAILEYEESTRHDIRLITMTACC